MTVMQIEYCSRFEGTLKRTAIPLIVAILRRHPEAAQLTTTEIAKRLVNTTLDSFFEVPVGDAMANQRQPRHLGFPFLCGSFLCDP